MIEIIHDIIDSDVIVLGSPMYFYSISAQLKNVIDRCFPYYCHIKNKEFYFIVSSASRKDDMELAMSTLEKFVSCMDNCIYR